MNDVFISYSRKDRQFAERLVGKLTEQGFTVWIDFEDIPFAVDWWEEIRYGIESADNAIFILSPDSLNSEVCGLEISQIRQYKKRLVPIVVRDVDAHTVGKELSHLNWIFFTDMSQFDHSFTALCETLRQDKPHGRAHTQLLQRANDWERKRYNPDLLLRGPDLAEMLPLQTSADLTSLQRDYLKASERRAVRNQRLLRLAWGFLGGIGVGFYAFTTYRSTNIFQPQRIFTSIAGAETFGVILGTLAVLADRHPLPFLRRLAAPVQTAVKMGLSLFFGMFFWSVFHGFLLNYAEEFFSILYLAGGGGIAFGFILQILFKLPAWLIISASTLAIWLPIYLFHDAFWAGTLDSALLYFDEYNQVFTIGILFALLIALGTNAALLQTQVQNLWARVRTQPASPQAETVGQ